MKNQRVTFPVVVAFLAGCVAAHAVTIPPARAEGPAVTRWEYTCTFVSPLSGPEEAAVTLNAFGKEGWELAAAQNSRYCFKRPM